MAASCLGVLEISLGNYGAAVGCLDPAYTDDTPLVGDPGTARPGGGRRPRRSARPGRTRAAGLADRATATGTPLALGLLARSQALLAAPDEAQQEVRGGARTCSAGPGPLRSSPAPTCSTASGCAASAGGGRHVTSCATAHDMFDAMGLDGFAERARVELRATGEHVRKREVGSPEELTPQEAQIAALVSRGEANREIAAQLFVSPSTVEYHLRKVFRKLGVTSRTQLAHRVINQGSASLGRARPWRPRPTPRTADPADSTRPPRLRAR